MKLALATVGVLLLLSAFPEQGFCEENAKPAGESSWYGYQILIADGLSYTALGVSIGAHNAPLAIVGLGSYAITSPVIHGFHHRPVQVVGSILLRMGLSLAGYAIASGGASCSGEDSGFCGFAHGLVGMGIGMVVATVVDASIAWDSPIVVRRASPPTNAGKRSPSLVNLSAVGVVPTSNGASLMLGGQF
jgi:hypothetical protein